MKMKQLLCMMLGLAIVFGPVMAGAGDPGTGVKRNNSLAKISGTPATGLVNINNMAMWIKNDGQSAINPVTGNSGVYFPRGTGAAIFADGFIWGGNVRDGGDPVLRVGGQTYNIGTLGGRIISPGVADNPLNPNVRLYRFRRDYATADLKQEAAEFFQIALGDVTAADERAIRDQYAKDKSEWPATEGAPYYDNDLNGAYDPNVDEPGYAGGDQVVWFVCNDLDPGATAGLYGSPPVGIELQVTLWGYARTDALGNAIFKRFRMIYKGTATTPANAVIDSMFVSQWSDPDLGDAGDDLAGCDVDLSVGFVYNGDENDGVYSGFGLAPPTSGYDFLAGPAVPGLETDVAIIDLKKVPGKKNLPMTSFIYFASGSSISDPTLGSYTGTLQWSNLQNGYQPRPFSPDPPIPYLDANGNAVTPFVLRGDPVTGTGDIDGRLIGPSDRRLALSSGPFTMALGDTQEVVVALLAGLGSKRLSSVSLFKFNDLAVQAAYNNLFQVPKPPVSPTLVVTPFDGKVLLDWGNNPTQVGQTEGQDEVGYLFEGYNIYQLPSAAAPKSQAIKIATYDLNNLVGTILDKNFDEASGVILDLPSQIGTNSGIKRFVEVSTDPFRGGTRLVNGQTYYFAVTAYNANLAPAATPHSLESPLLVQTVVPQSPKPGIRYAADATLEATHSGTSDGTVDVIVVNPARMTGDQYKVTFADDPDLGPVWNLIDVTKGNAAVLANQTNQTGDDNYFVTDGVQVKVAGPPAGMKSFAIPSGTRRFSPVGGFAGLNLEGFSSAGAPAAYDQSAGTIGMAGHFAFGGIGTTLGVTQYHTVLLKLAAVDHTALWDPTAAPADPNFSKAYRYLRAATAAPAKPEFAPWIINVAAGYPYQDFNYSAPFSAWDMETDPPTRLAVGTFENNVAGGWVDGRYWPPDAGGATLGGDNTAAREFAFIFATPYSETPDPSLMVNVSNNSAIPLMWVMVCNRRADVDWVAGDEFQINANHVNSAADEFTFTGKAPSSSDVVAKQDVDNIQAFPNPYLGLNRAETNQNNKYVTFSHLPAKATLRIFDLAGVLVRKLEKNDDLQFLRWDLLNETGLPTASGIYIVHIDMPAPIGKTKTMKLVLVNSKQQLRYF